MTTPQPADCHSGWAYREDFPYLTEAEWRQGLYWRWDIHAPFDKGHQGFMACYLARLPLHQWALRLWFEEYEPDPSPAPPLPAPAAQPVFQYPPGLDLDDQTAFWLHLDFSGPSNPADPGFEWAWMKPLRPVSEAKAFQYRETAPARSAAPTADPSTVATFGAYYAPDYVDYEQFLADLKDGVIRIDQPRCRNPDTAETRPRCPKCGTSHPDHHTPLSRKGDCWDHAKAHYACRCGHEWLVKGEERTSA